MRAYRLILEAPWLADVEQALNNDFEWTCFDQSVTDARLQAHGVRMNNIEGSWRHESLVCIAGIVRHKEMVARLFMTARYSRHVTRALFPLCG